MVYLLDIAIEWDDSTVVHDIAGQVFPSSNRVIAEFCYKPRHIRNRIHDPFRIRSLLMHPLEEINVVNFLIKAV